MPLRWSRPSFTEKMFFRASLAKVAYEDWKARAYDALSIPRFFPIARSYRNSSRFITKSKYRCLETAVACSKRLPVNARVGLGQRISFSRKLKVNRRSYSHERFWKLYSRVALFRP